MPIADWQVVFSRLFFQFFLDNDDFDHGNAGLPFRLCRGLDIVASSEGGEGLGQLFSRWPFGKIHGR